MYTYSIHHFFALFELLVPDERLQIQQYLNFRAKIIWLYSAQNVG